MPPTDPPAHDFAGLADRWKDRVILAHSQGRGYQIEAETEAALRAAEGMRGKLTNLEIESRYLGEELYKVKAELAAAREECERMRLDAVKLSREELREIHENTEPPPGFYRCAPAEPGAEGAAK